VGGNTLCAPDGAGRETDDLIGSGDCELDGFAERRLGLAARELRQGIEVPDSFILTVWWETLEDHTIAFKQSANFTQWRAEIGHLFAAPPVVHHYSQDV